MEQYTRNQLSFIPEHKKDDLILKYQDELHDSHKASVGAIGLFAVAAIIAMVFAWQSGKQKERAEKAEALLYTTTITKTGIHYGKNK